MHRHRKLRRPLAHWIIGTTLAGIVILCLFYWWGPEEVLLLAHIQYLPYPLLLLPALGRPTLLAGDFNAPLNSMVVRTLEAEGFRNAFSVSGFGFGFTYGPPQPATLSA